MVSGVKCYCLYRLINIGYNLYTVKPVHKGHSREPKNVAFMSSCPLYTG